MVRRLTRPNFGARETDNEIVILSLMEKTFSVITNCVQ
jgi:hypothetical protein